MDARDRGATSRAKGDAREGARRRASDAFDGVENVRANGTGRGIGASARARGGGSLRSREAIGCLDKSARRARAIALAEGWAGRTPSPFGIGREGFGREDASRGDAARRKDD